MSSKLTTLFHELFQFLPRVSGLTVKLTMTKLCSEVRPDKSFSFPI